VEAEEGGRSDEDIDKVRLWRAGSGEVALSGRGERERRLAGDGE